MKNSQAINRVLIIDDHRFVHEAFRRVLEVGLGAEPDLRALHQTLFGTPAPENSDPIFKVDAALTGEEGLGLLRKSLEEEQPYAVAFVDMRMPSGWDGLETVARLWEKSPELQIVICTAYADHSWETILQRLGRGENLAILRKPFEREEVLQLAYMFTRKWQAQVARQQPAAPPMEPSFRFLLLEDDPLTQKLLERQLKNRLADTIILPASTVAEAKAHLVAGHIDFFLLDVLVPDGSGIDYLCEVQTTQPDALVVMMTAQPLGEYRTAAEQLGVLRFMEKPPNMDEIVSLVKERQQAIEAAAAQGACSFAASLKQLTTLDVIQLKCLSRATTSLEFFQSDGGQGRLYFEDGEIIHAETGTKVGEAAFADIVAWRRGRVEERPFAKRPTQTINIAWQGLLLNTVQQLDEGSEALDAA